jgi:hypothetical protein
MSISKNGIRRIARQTWGMFLLVEGVGVLITGAALLDTIFQFGWGYDWNAVLIGLGILIWGAFVWWVCRAIFRFIAQLAE